MTQKRWKCADCGREWVWGFRWSEEQGCPACHSSSIAQIDYHPIFPGADIETKPEDLPAIVTDADLREMPVNYAQGPPPPIDAQGLPSAIDGGRGRLTPTVLAETRTPLPYEGGYL